MNISIQYPHWFLILCILLAGAYSFALYYRSVKESMQSWVLWVMSGFRFLAVFLISFLLLSPFLKQTTFRIEQPLIVVAQDNSQSIVMGKDSLFYRHQYPQMMTDFLEDLGKRYEVLTYSFGDKVRSDIRYDFSDQITDISALIQETEVRFIHRNVGAFIIATDGIFNFGTNPVYTASNFPFPVYTVLVGDTAIPRDIRIQKITYNRIVFLNDQFPVEIQIDAEKCPGEQVKVTIEQHSKILFTSILSVYGNRFSKRISTFLNANEKGLQHYRIRVTPVENETNLRNNTLDMYVEVQDSRQKIAIIYAAPHPDIGAIRLALESTYNYDVSEYDQASFASDTGYHDLLLFHQLPSVKDINRSDRIFYSKQSKLFILGTLTDIKAFNELNAGLLINADRLNYTESFPSLNSAFSYFTIPENAQRITDEFPPLLCPFGSYQYSPLSEILFYQKIGGARSTFPLVLFIRNPDFKTGIITGENLWRWRLSNYTQTGSHEIFDEIVRKIVQYLSVQSDKSFFRIYGKQTFFENEPVEFDADLYNESYELINQPDVNLTIIDSAGNRYPFLFSKTSRAYYLNAGNFPVGKYQYQATTTVGNKNYQATGIFVIAPLNLEELNLVADENLLYRLANSHAGKMIRPDQLPQLADELITKDDIHSISYMEKKYTDMIGNVWLFFLILLLFTLEWVLRKQHGM